MGARLAHRLALVGSLGVLVFAFGATAAAQPAPGDAPRPAERPAVERPAMERPAVERPAPTPPRRAGTVKPWETGVTPEKRKQAQALLNQGSGFYGKGQYAEALTWFQKAIKIWDHPAIRFNIGVCLVHLTQPVAAYKNILRALRYGKAPFKNPDHFRQAASYRKLLEGQLGRLRVVCKEPGAKVTLDGAELFTAPGEATRVLKPGKHQILASKKKFITTTKSIFLLPGKVMTVRLKMLSLKSAVKMKRRWKRWIPWTVLAAGAAGALVGLPLFFTAASDYKKFDQQVEAICGDLPAGGCTSSELPQSTKDYETRGDAKYYSSLVIFSVGGAVAAAGVVLIILNQPRAVRPKEAPAPKTTMTVIPSPLPGGGMVTWSLSF
jgi:hypothetical protein